MAVNDNCKQMHPDMLRPCFESFTTQMPKHRNNICYISFTPIKAFSKHYFVVYGFFAASTGISEKLFLADK